MTAPASQSKARGLTRNNLEIKRIPLSTQDFSQSQTDASYDQSGTVLSLREFTLFYIHHNFLTGLSQPQGPSQRSSVTPSRANPLPGLAVPGMWEQKT